MQFRRFVLLGLAMLFWGSALAKPYLFPSPVKEGRSTIIRIYSTLDIAAARPLVAGFQVRYPQFTLQYHELSSQDLHDRFLKEWQRGLATADVLLSSAMDLQMKLVNDGYIRSYDSPYADALPNWSTWRNEAFGFTFEPAVIVYNRDLLGTDNAPRSHHQLVRLLQNNPGRYDGKIATYDPARSGLGYLFATQDAKVSDEFWQLVKAFGESRVKLFTSTQAILNRIADGRSLIGYNLLGSYALSFARNNPQLAIILPEDYALVTTRIAVLPKRSSNPTGGERFIDFLLSRQGQQLVATKAQLYSIHPDVKGRATASALRIAAQGRLIPIRVSPSLMVNLDQFKRQKFFRQWERALGGRIDSH